MLSGFAWNGAGKSASCAVVSDSTMKAFLAITQGPDKGQVIPLDAATIRIGRDPSCEVTLSDPQVSRQHLKLKGTAVDWRLIDLNSSNGTLVNGEQVKLRPLDDGDIIIIGESMMGFHFSEEEPSGPFEYPGATDTQTISINEHGLYAHWEEEEEDVESLKRARADLEAIYRIGRTIHGIVEPDVLIPRLLEMIFEEMPRIDRGSLFLVDPEEPAGFRCAASRVRRHRGCSEDDVIYSSTMADQVKLEKSALLTYDAMADDRFSAGDSIHEQRIRAAIAAPLMVEDRVIGILFADSLKAQSRFSVDNLRFLAAIGLQTGTVIEKAILYKELIEEKAALQQAQQQLVQSEKLAAVGQLASGIVHDMKNPMTVILGYSGLIGDRLERLPREEREKLGISKLLNEIEGGVRHVNQVIEHLLMFARPESMDRRAADLGALVEDTLRFLQHETSNAGVKLEKRIPDRLPPVMVDESHIKQVFMNIVINAIQAMEPYEGRFRVSALCREDGDGEVVEVAFADNGCGMTEEQRNRVFEPFFTTKKAGSGIGGSGLGLSVSYSIVQNHGGTIEVESEIGRGTTFRVALPAVV